MKIWQPTGDRSYSRREFVKGIPLGLAGAFVLAVVSGRLLSIASRRRRRPPVVPPGSIFTAAEDPRAQA